MIYATQTTFKVVDTAILKRYESQDVKNMQKKLDGRTWCYSISSS